MKSVKNNPNLAKSLKAERALREKARRDLSTFIKLKWERYNKAAFMENWHIDYICKVLSHTLPEYVEKERLKNELDSEKALLDSEKRLPRGGGASNDSLDSEISEALDSECEGEKQAQNELITRLILNMPPSYGKTEIIARSFIAWALGRDRKRKFIYISYSDELCTKIANQVRDLIKSNFYKTIFGNLEFLQDKASEFVLKEGGGLFLTTLKSAITGFHAHQILIDDPIKVSEMGSKSARDLVNQNFKESVLSRLQDNKSNITILMQRLGEDDLCGFLLNKRNFEPEIINKWRVEKLKAIEQKERIYTIGNFTYKRKENEPLFIQRHNQKELQELKAQMGNDEFYTQYLQEPMQTQSGFFVKENFKRIAGYEVGYTNDYIFVDNATSIKTSADNRAIVCIGVENINNANRYVVRDCSYGIWQEQETASQIIDMMILYKNAKVFIESDGGGIALERILNQEIIKANTSLKLAHKELITNQISVYTPSRKLSKVDKIKAIKPYYNTGFLCFIQNARGLEQIEKELLSFNPEKPFKKDDCIDAIASAINHESVIAPSPNQSIRAEKKLGIGQRYKSSGYSPYARKVAWNI